MKDSGALPKLSAKLGELTRTNSEAIIGSARTSVDPDNDYSRGVAITSSIHPDETTHIEPCRYGKGSNAMSLLQTLASDGDPSTPRFAQVLKGLITKPGSIRLPTGRRWSERTMILLVMQSLDNSITTFTRKDLFGRHGYTSRQGHGEPDPTLIKAGYDANQHTAERIGGTAGGTWNEMVNIPLTAHFLGGATIAETPEDGVIDPCHRVHNHPGISVVDGSAITANLGVNPSLTITAQAERAFCLWPDRGEVDTRPAQGAAYRRVAPVVPVRPAVPADAPGALRLPIVDIKADGKSTPKAAQP
jgi:cholesterol oxidase